MPIIHLIQLLCQGPGLCFPPESAQLSHDSQHTVQLQWAIFLYFPSQQTIAIHGALCLLKSLIVHTVHKSHAAVVTFPAISAVETSKQSCFVCHSPVAILNGCVLYYTFTGGLGAIRSDWCRLVRIWITVVNKAENICV